MKIRIENTDYYFSIVDNKEFCASFDIVHKLAFAKQTMINSNQETNVPKSKPSKSSEVFKTLYRLNVVLFHNDKLIGTFWGKQIDQYTFQMVNTGIIPEYQNKGIYSHLFEIVKKNLIEREFTFITSRHETENNQVLITKLKLGFKVNGFEFDVKFGWLIKLIYKL